MIQSSEALLVRSKLLYVSKLFNVKVNMQHNSCSEDNEMTWVTVDGKTKEDVSRAKVWFDLFYFSLSDPWLLGVH